MMNTMDQAQWKEDPTEAALRMNLTPTSNPMLMRRLFPLQGRLTRYCRVHQMPPGTLMEFVRAKQAPAVYPLEAVVIRNAQLYAVSYGSDELDLISVI